MLVSRAKAEEAAALLDLPLEALDDAALSAAYRAAARRTHPDMEGGSQAAFARVDWAKHVLTGWLVRTAREVQATQPAKCSRCEGRGYVQSQVGFRKGPRVQCIRCAGTGDADYTPDKADTTFN